MFRSGVPKRSRHCRLMANLRTSSGPPLNCWRKVAGASMSAKNNMRHPIFPLALRADTNPNENTKNTDFELFFSSRTIRVVPAAESIFLWTNIITRLRTDAGPQFVAQDCTKLVIDVGNYSHDKTIWRLLMRHYQYNQGRTLALDCHQLKMIMEQMLIRCELLITFAIEIKFGSGFQLINCMIHGDASISVWGDKSGSLGGWEWMCRKVAQELPEETEMNAHHAKLRHIKWGMVFDEMRSWCPKTNKLFEKQFKIFDFCILLTIRELKQNGWINRVHDTLYSVFYPMK